jgi:hypothetical protein
MKVEKEVIILDKKWFLKFYSFKDCLPKDRIRLRLDEIEGEGRWIHVYYFRLYTARYHVYSSHIIRSQFDNIIDVKVYILKLLTNDPNN